MGPDVDRNSGTLFVVATPIGNLDDISVRARAVLGSVAFIAAEDTRRTAKLLDHLGVKNRLVSCHEHNEQQRSEKILAALRQGDDVALVSDAGTPLVSDPGYPLVSLAAEQGFNISPVPGCSAALAALSIAGLPTDAVILAGFMPASGGQRRARLEPLATRTETLVLFESVHRVADTLQDLIALFGADRQAVAARELTKLHETIYRGSLTELAGQIAADPGATKGEYTLIIGGAEKAPAEQAQIDKTLTVLLGYLGVRQAAEAAAKLLDIRKNEAYKRALQLRESSADEY